VRRYRHLAHKEEEKFENTLKRDVEGVLEEEMSEHLGVDYRELTPTRKGERNGYYERNLVKIERLKIPRDRESEFCTEVFERYRRVTGNVEAAILEMYLSGISTHKIAGVTAALSKVRIGKHVVSRIAGRLGEQQRAWRERPLKEKAYLYPYLDATYLKVNWGGNVTDLALLAAPGVNEDGFREVLAVKVAGGE
jgi:transposase-like protein